jgi:hypothetical protein
MGTMSEEPRNWYLTIRTADQEYSFCCMSKEKAMETLVNEVDRLGGGVLEAELRHPSGRVETLPLT